MNKTAVKSIGGFCQVNYKLIGQAYHPLHVPFTILIGSFCAVNILPLPTEFCFKLIY